MDRSMTISAGCLPVSAETSASVFHGGSGVSKMKNLFQSGGGA
jgi:hypothetical protein